MYFLFNSFTKHRSSNLQLSPDCSVQYINCKFNNQFSVHYLTMRLRQHKQNSQVQNLPCRSSLKQQRYVCIMSVNKSQIHARNKCFLYKIRTETDEKTPPMVYAIWRHQFSDLTTISDNSIRLSVASFSPVPPAQCCFAGSKKYRKKSRHHCSNIERGEAGEGFCLRVARDFWLRLYSLYMLGISMGLFQACHVIDFKKDIIKTAKRKQT